MSIRSHVGAVCPTHGYKVLAHHRPAETMRAGGANPSNDHGRYGALSQYICQHMYWDELAGAPVRIPGQISSVTLAKI